ncbi:colicin E1 family microcin immunity protein [Brenneria rubrifaciens]|uniref:Colicin transporter n=1 Tax=Brenneria rubrifaciens TaxID=55213 RepID=A0A4P8QZD9_9GAMM|nr:colicin E1 family microcin immunity protein [Brenneria rubrifaciens]QCR08754.1 hypothetical protein EH207_09545 [Brenneria rubrifaciens]
MKNFFIGIGMVAIFGFVCYKQGLDPDLLCHVTILSTLSALLFPFGINVIEKAALRFTSREFWRRGLFIETIGKNGLYVIYYGFCFFLAIPLSVIYFFCLITKKNPAS